MERTRVSSSNIASIGYDSASSTLEVEFNESGVYVYFDVPAHAYDALMAAPSHGKYFSAFIKQTYRFAKR